MSDFSNVSGPPFLGYIFNVLLCGVLIVQVYLYYMAFGQDRAVIKTLVYTVFILEVAQTVIMSHDKFDLYAKEFGTPLALDEQRIAWFAVPVLTAINSAIVQAFFGYRILTFSKSWILAGVVWALTLLQCGAGLAQGALSFSLTLGEVGEKTRTTISIWFITSAVNDVLIALVLSYYLNRMKTGIEKSDAVVTRIIRLTVETGTVTAILALLVVILFYVGQTSGPWFLMLSDCIGKVYSNNMMVMFNRRLQVSHGQTTEVHSSSRSQGSRVPVMQRQTQFSVQVQSEGTLSGWNDTISMKQNV